MKKWLVTAAMVCVLTTAGFGAAAMAGAATRGAAPQGGPVGAQSGNGAVPNGLVKPESQWTLYDLAFQGSADSFLYGPCEVLTFQSHGTFSGDKGDVGRWKGNIKLTFTNNTFFPDGTYTGKYLSSFSEFQGDDETGNAWAGVGPLRMYAGNDPKGVGDC
jgi:hypothetical protein